MSWRFQESKKTSRDRKCGQGKEAYRSVSYCCCYAEMPPPNILWEKRTTLVQDSQGSRNLKQLVPRPTQSGSREWWSNAFPCLTPFVCLCSARSQPEKWWKPQRAGLSTQCNRDNFPQQYPETHLPGDPRFCQVNVRAIYPAWISRIQFFLIYLVDF